MKFKNKVVLVTGSSQGLGAELIKSFAEEGSKVIINYFSSKKKAETLVSKLSSDSLLIKADVSDEDQVSSMFSQIENSFGRLDILVNNAAIYDDSTVWNMDNETWEKVIDTDLKGVFNCTKQASKIMRSQTYGRIVNISSVVGQTSSFGTSNYAAAKAGVMGFTRGVATELANKNITVNTLSLGFIETGMFLRLPQNIQDNIIKKIPLGRWGRIEEVVETVHFLCSKNAGYITGQTINLNGGYYM